jgi:hypothetical protein
LPALVDIIDEKQKNHAAGNPSIVYASFLGYASFASLESRQMGYVRWCYEPDAFAES